MPFASQVESVFGDIVRIIEHLDRYVNSNTQNLNNHLNTLQEDLGLAGGQTAGDRFVHSSSILSGVRNYRASIETAVRLGRSMLDPVILEYGRTMGFPERDPFAILQRLRVHFWDANRSVLYRNFTFGAISDLNSGALGDGSINRLSLDEENQNIENTWEETVVAECIQDEHSGAVEHEEIFECRGTDLGEDALELRGSGAVARIKALSARDSLPYIQNPSFSDDAAADPPTSISGWTVFTGVIADIAIVSTAGQYFRDFEGDTTPRALRFDTNVGIRQNFSVRRAQFNRFIPVYVQLAFRPGTATAGTLTLRFGAVSATATITTADSTWRALRIGPSTDNWLVNFNEEDPTLEIELSGSNGTIFVDDIIVAPFVNFNGIWYAPVGGSEPFLRGKRFRWSHTAGSRTAGTQGLIQHWLWRLYGTYLRHVNAAPTWAEPSV